MIVWLKKRKINSNSGSNTHEAEHKTALKIFLSSFNVIRKVCYATLSQRQMLISIKDTLIYGGFSVFRM
ncbi:MAG: hypothetical protein CVT92_13360 [Bacteroidetes bacterium HGW-Bacteroidetes-1]|jgi:hypothetical protein|nr:MAG: hypothetical protein CVT92_13360 [Bacteroidetes bacterium HGW-Bacteroidetes-1]